MQIMPRCLLLPRCIASLALLNTWSRSGESVGNTEKPIEAVSVTGWPWTWNGWANAAAMPIGKRLGVLRVVAGHLQTEEFVAALARQKLARRKLPAHPVGDLDQQQVAGAVAEHVVDVLEAVDVDRECGELVGLLVRLGGIEGEPFVERDPVREAGHGVVE